MIQNNNDEECTVGFPVRVLTGHALIRYKRVICKVSTVMVVSFQLLSTLWPVGGIVHAQT